MTVGVILGSHVVTATGEVRFSNVIGERPGTGNRDNVQYQFVARDVSGFHAKTGTHGKLLIEIELHAHKQRDA
jgi:hypothetical protein